MARVQLPVLGGEACLLTEPDHVEQVLVHRNRNHWKGRLFNRADFLFGRGLVLADGRQWQRQRRLMQPVPGWVPIPGQRRARRAVRFLDDMVYRIIDQRAAGTRPAANDLLAMLMDARDENGMAMTRHELRDQVITVLFDGYEATAHAMAWTWSLLDGHPAVDARFRAEIAAASSAADLPYTRQILNESAHRYAYFPFGAGQRLCIGRSLAILEMQLILWILARRFRPRLTSPGRVPHQARSTLRSRSGIHMTLDPA
jgi:cytochrome P450